MHYLWPSLPWQKHTKTTLTFDKVATCGGVLEGTFWSPWPWPQVLENWPVLGSRTALFFELLKFCRSPEKKILEGVFYWKTPEKFFWRLFWDRLKKNFWRPLFLVEHLRLCPWSLALVSSIPVLGLGFFLCPWPEPRALCPRLHLWLQQSNRTRLLAKYRKWDTIRYFLNS